MHLFIPEDDFQIFTLDDLRSRDLNPRRWKGEGNPQSFLKWQPNRSADRAEILHTYGASFAQLFVKKRIDWVMSGHGAMAS